MPSDYVDPCTPPSPSISLVHAYRDKQLVSVPCNLLVQGDVIVLGPGHSAPAQVQQVNRNSLEWSFKFLLTRSINYETTTEQPWYKKTPIWRKHQYDKRYSLAQLE